MKKFNPLLVEACQQALSKKICSKDQLTAFVIKRIGFGCTANLLEHAAIDNNVSDRAKRDRELFTRLEEMVKASPRGSYAIVERTFTNDGSPGGAKATFQTIVSDGSGEVATGGKFNSYGILPSPDTVLTEMVTHEIHDCVDFCRLRQQINDSRAAIRKHNLRAGLSITNIDIPGDTNQFAKAYVSHVNFETGLITLQLYRRGRTTAQQKIIPAYHFALYANLDREEQPKMPAKEGKALQHLHS